MNLTIHTYGYIDVMYNTLQAIAMFHQSDAYLYLVQGVWFCMGCFYAVHLVQEVRILGNSSLIFIECLVFASLLTDCYCHQRIWLLKIIFPKIPQK